MSGFTKFWRNVVAARLPLGLLLLLFTVALTYWPSLAGGYLNWDDPWLIRDNPFLTQPSLSNLRAIWTDLSMSTRVALGAEYLPLRDTSHWLEALVFGLHPWSLRLVSLAIYLCCIVCVHGLLSAALPSPKLALLATACFALHPLHVESVAWLAGRKDVLAMLFVALALSAYVRRGRYELLTALWFFLAMLSKSMSVTLPLLLPLFDLWMGRRPHYRTVLVSLSAVAVVMPLHLIVGRLVNMTSALPGGNVSSALATMAPVWWRYLGILLWPTSCSLVHDVPTRLHWQWLTFLSYAGWAALFAGAWIWWRRRQEVWGLVALGFFWLPLLPVTQLLAPLQNRMADRYLWWSVLAVSSLAVALVRSLPRAGSAVTSLFLFSCVLLTTERAWLFRTSARVFADATAKTSESGMAPYQLAMALENEGKVAEARAAYEEVWRRTAGRDELSRRASNNLARLEARQGQLDRAEAVLRRGLAFFPNDPKLQRNLAKVLAKKELHE